MGEGREGRGQGGALTTVKNGNNRGLVRWGKVRWIMVVPAAVFVVLGRTHGRESERERGDSGVQALLNRGQGAGRSWGSESRGSRQFQPYHRRCMRAVAGGHG